VPKSGASIKQQASRSSNPIVQKNERSANQRGALLAARIEEGAAALVAFTEGLSENEWHQPVSATDRRSICVIVHHVASMYPIEIELARAVASGRIVSDVTWDVVAQLNAKHAQDNAQVSKSAALELLRQNSRDAAAAVRTLTDQELDSATPFSLSFGAPMTAQFVIEDHALRHSWHHLAAIRKALGR
jgi:DinB family protein